MSLDRTGKEAGVSRQLDESRSLAESMGLHVVHELSDNDISATTGKVRPAFVKLRELLEKGVVDTVVVWHPDRLYRTLKDLVPLMDLAQRKGLSIVSVTAGEMDLNTPHGRMVAGILGSISTNEGEHKAERQKLAYKTRATQGHWAFTHRPYGYEKAADGSVVQVPAEAAVLREIYARYYDGGESRHALMRDLNARGLTTSKGREWTITQLREVMSNPGYAGYIRYQGEVVGRGFHEPIISPEDWDRYTGAASKRKVTNSFSRTATSLASGLITCAVCGGKVYRRARADGVRHSYVCVDNLCVSITTGMVDQRIREEALTALLLGPSALVPVDKAGVSLTGLTEALSAIQGRRSDLLELVSEGLAKVADVKAKLERLKAEETTLVEQRDDLAKSNVAAEILLDIKADLFAGKTASIAKGVEVKNVLAARFDSMPLRRQRDLVSLLMTIELGKGRGLDRLYVTHKAVPSLNDMSA